MVGGRLSAPPPFSHLFVIAPKVIANCLLPPDSGVRPTWALTATVILTEQHFVLMCTHTAAVSVLPCVFCWGGGVVLHRSHHTDFSESVWWLQPELQALCSHSFLPSSLPSFCWQSEKKKCWGHKCYHPCLLLFTLKHKHRTVRASPDPAAFQ